ncbi:MAG: hypothetical protein JWQ56_3841 [Pseudarthrobacter sp.]|nr:hypothetical protein [Pseudarthrobacter sp.]
MKRTFATLGVVGLAAFAVAAPAIADGGSENDDKIIICHAGSGSNSERFTSNSVAVPSLNGHDHHGADIIPPNRGLENGQNWGDIGRAIYANGCVTPAPEEEEKPPVEVPPVEVPPVEVPPVEVPPVEAPPVETPVVETPVVAPPVEQPAVVPPVTVPPAAAAVVVPQQPAAAGAGAVATTELGTNQGYNAQTAVGGSNSPSWLAGVGALVAAGAAVAFRRGRRTVPLAD